MKKRFLHLFTSCLAFLCVFSLCVVEARAEELPNGTPINAYGGVSVNYYNINYATTDYSEPVVYFDEYGGTMTVSEEKILLDGVHLDKGLKITGRTPVSTEKSQLNFFKKAKKEFSDFTIEINGNCEINSHGMANGICFDTGVDYLIFSGDGTLKISDYTTGIYLGEYSKGIVFDGVSVDMTNRTGATGIDLRNCGSEDFFRVSGDCLLQLAGTKQSLLLPEDASGKNDFIDLEGYEVAASNTSDNEVKLIEPEKLSCDDAGRLTIKGNKNEKTVLTFVVALGQ